MEQKPTITHIVTGRARDIIITASRQVYHIDDQLMDDVKDVLPEPGADLQEAWDDLLRAVSPRPDLLELDVEETEYAAFIKDVEDTTPSEATPPPPRRRPRRRRTGRKRNGGSHHVRRQHRAASRRPLRARRPASHPALAAASNITAARPDRQSLVGDRSERKNARRLEDPTQKNENPKTHNTVYYTYITTSTSLNVYVYGYNPEQPSLPALPNPNPSAAPTVLRDSPASLSPSNPPISAHHLLDPWTPIPDSEMINFLLSAIDFSFLHVSATAINLTPPQPRSSRRRMSDFSKSSTTESETRVDVETEPQSVEQCQQVHKPLTYKEELNRQIALLTEPEQHPHATATHSQPAQPDVATLIHVEMAMFDNGASREDLMTARKKAKQAESTSDINDYDDDSKKRKTKKPARVMDSDSSLSSESEESALDMFMIGHQHKVMQLLTTLVEQNNQILTWIRSQNETDEIKRKQEPIKLPVQLPICDENELSTLEEYLNNDVNFGEMTNNFLLSAMKYMKCI
ncbi:hypothetical protein MSG28_011720 [Choristoneura fumiferana]|uniref:Uncharacterized protein n=1 Tax=Choristoneura fumiferana TaxID=7141 RepID=A0ACC0KLJ8_CHOFU|nr:hypothetical protein MSG28_011720 [Choristoneura fumiferana]